MASVDACRNLTLSLVALFLSKSTLRDIMYPYCTSLSLSRFGDTYTALFLLASCVRSSLWAVGVVERDFECGYEGANLPLRYRQL